MSDLAEHLKAVWTSGAPIRPGGEIDWDEFATALRARLVEDVEAYFRDHLPPYLFPANEHVPLPTMRKITVNEAIRDVWWNAKEQVIDLLREGDAVSDVASVVCPSCGAGPGTLRIEVGYQAEPVGMYSRSGLTMKFSATEVPVLTCTNCNLRVFGKVES